MRAAAALEPGECLTDLRIVRARVLLEQRHRGHDPAVETVSALRHLLGDEGGLHLVRLVGIADAGERGDGFAAERIDRGYAGARRLAVHQHRAGAALGEPTAKPWIPHAEVIAQGVEQRHIRLRLDGVPGPVDVELNALGHRVPPLIGAGPKPPRGLVANWNNHALLPPMLQGRGGRFARTRTQPGQAGMTATPWISSSAFGLARCEMAIEALAGKSLPKISRRIAVIRGWLRGSVMNTVMVTMSESLPPASSSVAPRFANTCRTWASKSPASDLPEESVAPVCPASQMVLLGPSVITASE